MSESSEQDRSWERRADRLAARSIADGDPTGWFEQLYAAGRAGDVEMPWDHSTPHRLLAEWTGSAAAPRPGSRALVVGAGLGGDAEHVASLGYRTTAFDVSPSAVEIARARHPGTAVHYVVADAFDPPQEWLGGFDLVVEIYTVQALPVDLREAMVAAVAGFVAPGGTLLVVAAAAEEGELVAGPPWPLTHAELSGFETDGLRPVRVELNRSDAGRLWRAEFGRPDPVRT